MVPLINCFTVWYLIMTLGWGVCKDGWPWFAERFAWPERSYKQLLFVASLANDIFALLSRGTGCVQDGFLICFLLFVERVPLCRADQQLQLALWVPTMLGSRWKPSTLLLGLIFRFFGGVCLVFISPSQPGWEDMKPRVQNGHSRPFCATAAILGTRGHFCPSSRRLKILLEIQGPDFPLGNPPCPLSSAPTRDRGFTKAESGVSF